MKLNYGSSYNFYIIFITTLELLMKFLCSDIKLYLVNHSSTNYVYQFETGIILFYCVIVFVLYFTTSNRYIEISLDFLVVVTIFCTRSA